MHIYMAIGNSLKMSFESCIETDGFISGEIFCAYEKSAEGRLRLLM